MYITIAGELGSGKSTVAKLIHKKYGFEIYSTGTVQREIAKEKGITTLELNVLMANDIDNDYDKLIDNKTVEIAKANLDKDVIFDSRMAWHFVEQSFKVYVIVDNYVAANRVIKEDRGSEEHYNTIDEAAEGLYKRKKIEDSRFFEMYHVNTLNFENYDLVVDSTDISPDELAEFIITKAKESYGDRNIFVSPRRLFPTQPMSNIDPLHVKELQEKEAEALPVDAILYDGHYFIIEGHHRACARIQNGDKLIEINVLKADENNRVEKLNKTVQELVQTDGADYHDWEAYNSVKLVKRDGE